MNIETLSIPAFVTVLAALAALVSVPAASMAMSRTPASSAAGAPEGSGGASCDLPPMIDVSGGRGPGAVLPPLDEKEPAETKTATFAMG